MKKSYRGWKLTFNKGLYTATKAGRLPQQAYSRIGIERKVDTQETIKMLADACNCLRLREQRA